MYIVAGAAAHSSFKKTQLLNRLASMSSVQSFDSQWVYLFDQALNEQQHQAALQLLKVWHVRPHGTDHHHAESGHPHHTAPRQDVPRCSLQESQLYYPH